MEKNEEKQRSLLHIPEEILIQIFEILSLKSLAKALSVSKHWHCLIYNSINLTRPKILFTSESFICGAPFVLSSIDSQSRVEKLSLPKLMLSKPSKDGLVYRCTFKTKLKFSGSCNGLVLVEAGDSFYLWNPLTKYSVTLPFTLSCYSLILGLCHNSCADKYKVVVALRNWQMGYVCAYVLVVCSETASSVRVDFDCPFRSFRPGPVLNGYLHSLSVKINQYGSKSRECIIAFNPRVDLFSDVPMPDPRDMNGDLLLGLGVLGQCLCIARRESPVIKTSNIEILIMKEYGVASSWTIMCSIRNFDCFGYINMLVPLCYNNDGEALVHINGQRIKSLNISENLIMEIGGVSQHCHYNTVFYEENWGTPHK